MNLPTKKFGVGGISVAVWENQGKEGNNYYTVSFERRYKDKGGEWKSTTSLKANDLPKAILALEKAYEFIALKEPLMQSEEKEEAFAAAMA
ncbi:MAG: hypothetical protein WC634_03115 [archaeon]